MIGLHPSRVMAVVFRFPFSESISCLFQKWEREYYLDRCIETFRERWCDTPPSAAYTYTITTHPSETHHPLWKEASKTKVEEDELGRKITLPLYRRRTTSAAFQLAVDHAFMGTYAKHFRPSDPPESLLCTCEVCFDPLHTLSSPVPSTTNIGLTQASTHSTAPSPFARSSPLAKVHPNSSPFYKEVALLFVLWTWARST